MTSDVITRIHYVSGVCVCIDVTGQTDRFQTQVVIFSTVGRLCFTLSVFALRKWGHRTLQNSGAVSPSNNIFDLNRHIFLLPRVNQSSFSSRILLLIFLSIHTYYPCNLKQNSPLLLEQTGTDFLPVST